MSLMDTWINNLQNSYVNHQEYLDENDKQIKGTKKIDTVIRMQKIERGEKKVNKNNEKRKKIRKKEKIK